MRFPRSDETSNFAHHGPVGFVNSSAFARVKEYGTASQQWRDNERFSA